MCETLFEVVVEHAWFGAHHRECRVVAHGTERISKLRNHRLQHELHSFLGITERLHSLSQCLCINVGTRSTWDVGKFQALCLKPVSVGSATGEIGLEFLVGNHAALLKVDEEDLPRLQTAFGHHSFGGNGNHADLRSHDAFVIVGDVVARRPQPVAIEDCTDVGAIGKGD